MGHFDQIYLQIRLVVLKNSLVIQVSDVIDVKVLSQHPFLYYVCIYYSKNIVINS